MRLLLDHSIVESFAMGRRKAVMSRVYQRRPPTAPRWGSTDGAACPASLLDDERWRKIGKVVDSRAPHVRYIVSRGGDPNETRNQVEGPKIAF